MSATARGSDRIENDVYPTPPWCTRRILESLIQDHDFFSGSRARNGTWLEPCAGEFAIANVVHEFLPSAEIVTGDVRKVAAIPSYVTHHEQKTFSKWTDRFDVVITNPPFCLAPKLIRHFLPRCDWLVLLLRASFKLGEWRRDMPDEYKLPQRPSFCHSDKCTGCDWRQTVPIGTPKPRACPVRGCGWPVTRSSSDAAEYSWFVWTPERGRSRGLTSVLPDTPESERCQ